MSDEEFDDLTSLFQELDLPRNDEITSIVSTIKEIFISNKENREAMSKSIDKYLIPAEIEKKANAEVSTPYELRQEMLDTIPKDFWTTPKKVLEPCCGKGGFVIDIFNRFKEGGLDERTIIEECIYFGDINSLNIFITSLLLNPDHKYKLNVKLGDALLIEWNVKFDTVIGNPPYNSSGTVGSGNSIWQHFTRKSIQDWTVEGGYISMVHPSGWRKPEDSTSRSKTDGMFKLMTSDNTMLKLVIRGLQDGKKAFNCGTRYDYYLIQRTTNTGTLTRVDDEFYKVGRVDMREWNWFPNHSVRLVGGIIASGDDERLSVIYSTNYDPRRNFVSKYESEEFKYPLIHSTTLNGIRYCYSSVNDKGHFGISKVIFGDSGINDVVIDLEGDYGMTQHAFALEVSDKTIAVLYKESLLCDTFKLILNACLWSNFQIDWKLFRHFKKDFYKYLMDSE